MAFYDFPAEHWVHLRTSNVIESTFAMGFGAITVLKSRAARAYPEFCVRRS